MACTDFIVARCIGSNWAVETPLCQSLPIALISHLFIAYLSCTTGVGKSTLLLQMAGSVASVAARSAQYQGIGMGPPKPSPTTASSFAPSVDTSNNPQQQSQQQHDGGPVIYISGEENASQIASRALRLGIQDPELLLWCETDADVIADRVANSAYDGSQYSSFDNPIDTHSTDIR